MDAQAAARLGDEIAHGFGLAAMVVGAVAGALIGAAVVAATVATGGAALAIMAGTIAAGGLSMFQVCKGLTTIFNLPEPMTGVLLRGSGDTYINGRPAMRAGADVSASCSGFPCNHPFLPMPVLIAQGSGSVYINGKPAARLQSKLVCGAHIKSGSPNVFIGGPTVGVAFVFDLEGWAHTGLEILGMAALAGAAVLAATAGVAAFAMFAGVTGAFFGGMQGLALLGDRLGPGYSDLLQGVAGLAMLGLSPKLAELGKGEPEPIKPNNTSNAIKSDRVPMTQEKFDEVINMERGNRPADVGEYLPKDFIEARRAKFETEGGSFVVIDSWITDSKYPTFPPRKFVGLPSEMDAAIAEYRASGNDPQVLNKALDLGASDLSAAKIYLVKVEPGDPRFSFDMPNGNEAGAYPNQWVPGGETKSGTMEAALIGSEKIVHNQSVQELLDQFPNWEQLQ